MSDSTADGRAAGNVNVEAARTEVRENRPAGAATAGTVLPAVTRGQHSGKRWEAIVDFGDPDLSAVPYVPGMTLKWMVTIDAKDGPAVQLIGPAEPDLAMRQLRHVVEAWIDSRPDHGA
jgi:hypothetical protein